MSTLHPQNIYFGLKSPYLPHCQKEHPWWTVSVPHSWINIRCVPFIIPSRQDYYNETPDQWDPPAQQENPHVRKRWFKTNSPPRSPFLTNLWNHHLSLRTQSPAVYGWDCNKAKWGQSAGSVAIRCRLHSPPSSGLRHLKSSSEVGEQYILRKYTTVLAHCLNFCTSPESIYIRWAGQRRLVCNFEQLYTLHTWLFLIFFFWHPYHHQLNHFHNFCTWLSISFSAFKRFWWAVSKNKTCLITFLSTWVYKSFAQKLASFEKVFLVLYFQTYITKIMPWIPSRQLLQCLTFHYTFRFLDSKKL